MDRRKVTTVMERRDYQPEGFNKPISGILVGVCESYGTVLTIAAQWWARINALRRTARPTTKPLEARVSPELDDAFNLIVAELGEPADLMQPGLLRFYLHLVAESPEVAALVKERSAKFPSQLAGPRWLSVRVAPGQFQDATRAAKAAGLRTKGKLLHGVAELAVEDCRITFRDSDGQLVTSKPDVAGRGRFKTLSGLAKVLA